MKYGQLPERIQEKLAKVHFHAEHVEEGEIVYKEKDLLDFYSEEIRREWTPIGKEKPSKGDQIFFFCLVTLKNDVVREAIYSRDDESFKTPEGTSLNKTVLAWRLMPNPFKTER